jgi:hypothetical protein
MRNRLILRALRRLLPESAARMNRRLYWASLLRGILWQGENAPESGHDRTGMDPALLPHYEQELLDNIKKGESCSTEKETKSFTSLAACAEPYQAGGIIRIPLYWKYQLRRSGTSLDR